jgi:hypothetical protein
VLSEEHAVLFVEHVHPFAGIVSLVAINTFAVVAGEIRATIGKMIASYLTVVLAARANLFGLLKPVRL